MQWNLSGSYFETCNCDTACPCAFKSAPSKGECTLLVGWHIEKGYFGDTQLDGLNITLTAYSPGHMMEVQWKAALYIDENATAAQKSALTEIFTGRAGGDPARLASHVGEFLGIKSVPIEFKREGKHAGLRIPQIAEVDISDLTDDEGNITSISSRPWSIAPGYSSVVAKSDHMDYDDYDFHWHLSGENGFHSPFEYRAT